MSGRRPQHRLHAPVELPRVAALRVLYADTDGMGIVYHGNYVRFLEHGRIEHLRQHGSSYADVERRGYAVPVTDLEIRYAAPALFDDVLGLHVGVVELTRARLRFAYRIIVAPGDRPGLDRPLLIAEAETGHCCIDRREGRPVRFPDDLHAILAASPFLRGRTGP